MKLPAKCVVCYSPYMAYVKTLPTKLGGSVDLFYCMECESFCSPFSKPNPLTSEIDWHKSVLDRNLTWCAELLPMLEPRAPIIDIGCGIGSLLLAAKRMGIEGIGYDLDEPACAYGRDQFGLNLRGEHWSKDTSPSAGLITCVSVLEHLHQPRPLIEEMIAAARHHKCSVFVSVPFVNRDWWRLTRTESLTPGHIFEYPHVHVTHFSWKGMQAIADQLGASAKLIQVPKAWTGFLLEPHGAV